MPIRKQSDPAFDDIPLLEDVVEAEAPTRELEASPEPDPEVPEPPARTAETIPLDILSEVLTERIAALTDRLLRDASAEIHATLVNKVWEKLREEIPELVEAAIRENGGND